MADRVGIAVVGHGYWGPNMVRNFYEAEGVDLRWVCDLQSERLDKVARRYPTVQLSTNLREVLADPKVDAVCIATPSETHHALAREVLCSGRHVLVEKPLCDSSDKVTDLIELADRVGRVLMVDHTFLYNPAVRCIRGIVDSGRLGNLLYFDSTRVNLGLFQRDVNVLWDLAVHDLAMMDYLMPGHRAVAVSATGIAHVPGQPENMAYLTCFFEDNLVAHIHANWLAPVKLRRTLICGESQMIVYDGQR
jgi:predicted dehydrogenase